MFFIFLGIGN